jgi:CheY-like chemotaxis protein
MSRISVLVADDNRPIRELLTSALAEYFRVFPPVADGRALIEAALRRRPDVIVSDVSMPVLDGIAAMRLLKTLGCQAPFVMVSADYEVGPECLAAGAAAFVCKEDIGRDLVPAVTAAWASNAVSPALPDRRRDPIERRQRRPTSSSGAGTAIRR